MFFFQQFQQNSSGNRKRIRQLRAPSLLDSGGLVSLLLLPAPRQAGRACSALCVLISYQVLVAVRFGLWTMMAERCFSVDDSIVLFSSNFSKSSSVIASYFVFFFQVISATAAAFVLFSSNSSNSSSVIASCGHRRCWTAAAWCPYYSCRRRAKPVGLVMPCGCCSRTRCCALFIADDDGGAFFLG